MIELLHHKTYIIIKTKKQKLIRNINDQISSREQLYEILYSFLVSRQLLRRKKLCLWVEASILEQTKKNIRCLHQQ